MDRSSSWLAEGVSMRMFTAADEDTKCLCIANVPASHMPASQHSGSNRVLGYLEEDCSSWSREWLPQLVEAERADSGEKGRAATPHPMGSPPRYTKCSSPSWRAEGIVSDIFLNVFGVPMKAEAILRSYQRLDRASVSEEKFPQPGSSREATPQS